MSDGEIQMTTTEHIDYLDRECEVLRKIAALYYKHLSEKCRPAELNWIDQQAEKIRQETK